MKKVLPSVSLSEQKGFLKERYIGENICIRLLLLHKKQLTGILLLTDFEKASYSLKWDYLVSVLKAYNFENDFKTWFSILYKIVAAVL